MWSSRQVTHKPAQTGGIFCFPWHRHQISIHVFKKEIFRVISDILRVSCQLDAFQMDAVNFQHSNKTRSSWTRPNEARPR